MLELRVRPVAFARDPSQFPAVARRPTVDRISSADKRRLIAVVDELERQFQRSAFKGNDELVFCHPKRGSKIDHEWYAGEFRAALQRAGISDYVRPFHDARHGSLTNGAAAGEPPIALMTRAGHRSMQTTKVYLHLAGTVFPDEAAALERRLLGGSPATDSQDPLDAPARHP